jgi:hypothetical protein
LVGYDGTTTYLGILMSWVHQSVVGGRPTACIDSSLPCRISCGRSRGVTPCTMLRLRGSCGACQPLSRKGISRPCCIKPLRSLQGLLVEEVKYERYYTRSTQPRHPSSLSRRDRIKRANYKKYLQTNRIEEANRRRIEATK